MKKVIAIAFIVSFSFSAKAQIDFYHETFTHADTLRGSNTPQRAWWDVLRYDITVKPDYATKTIEGSVIIKYKSLKDGYYKMQIDLQDPLIIDSVISYNHFQQANAESVIGDSSIKKIGNAYIIKFGPYYPQTKFDNYLKIVYHGTPREAVRPPWDGGWIWTKDSLGRPWMTVACQGLGASAWYPCKDYQGDEPDNGASLTMIVPDTLMAVANGRMDFAKKNNDGTTTYKWEVKNPINNYDIIPYIGYYKNFSEIYKGEKGNLDVNYWALDYDVNRFKSHVQPEVRRMLKAFEYWMGPYPFYEDGYKIIEAPHLGMEHQSAIAYGNNFRNGYYFRKTKWIDLSASGWGFKWDFIVVHESGHEWFGNNITTKDIADMWVHEGFTNYSESLFTEYYYGKDAGDEYNYGLRKRITNKQPVIAHYGVNEEPDLDEYYKASNMLNTIRHSINDDDKFRTILRGLNKTFYHQTVTTNQIESYISQHAEFNYSKVFDQYLRTIQIPEFEFYFSADKKKIYYRWDSCVAGFNLPLALKNDYTQIKLYPNENWQSTIISTKQIDLFNVAEIDKKYYIYIKELKNKTLQ